MIEVVVVIAVAEMTRGRPVVRVIPILVTFGQQMISAKGCPILERESSVESTVSTFEIVALVDFESIAAQSLTSIAAQSLTHVPLHFCSTFRSGRPRSGRVELAGFANRR